MKRHYMNKVVNLFFSILLLLTMVLYSQIATAAQNYYVNEQQKTIKVVGTIIDQTTQTPLQGATVLIKGTTIGVVSDENGIFQIDAPEQGSLIITCIGYSDKEVKVEQNLRVVLAESSEFLEEVVVVGYSAQKRESLTGALKTLKSDKITNITTPNVENMLNGKVPGVFVASGSGQPGSSGRIIIRGKSTINGSTDPLWVIDGVIIGSSSGALNPADIESMTLLKDAASTAIYGSQGANGVIVVTTKKAKTEGNIIVNASAKVGITQLDNGNIKMMNGAQLYDYYSSFQNAKEINFARWNPELRNDNYDWWDLASQTGVAQDYNISLSGGTKKLNSFFSIGYYDETGAVKGYDYNRYNARLKAEYKPFEWLSIKPQIYGALKMVDNKQHSITSMYTMLPWDNPYDENGLPMPHKSPKWVNSNSTNYLYDLQWNWGKSTDYEFMGNLDFDIKLTDFLTFISINNFRWLGGRSKSYTDPRSSAFGADSKLAGRVYEYYGDTQRRYTNQMLRYNQLIGKHSINAILGYEFNDYKFGNIGAQGLGIVPGFEILDVTTKPESVGGGISEWAVQSIIFNANYAYDNRYLAQVSFRRDGASNFGSNRKYGNFFSVSGGWNIHNEEFMKDVNWVNNLKLRASYGSNGNRPNALYPQYDLYSVSAKYNEKNGALISQIGNKDLTWEKTWTLGIGLDAVLFDRVRLTFDYYNKKTSDLLYAVPISGVVGVTSIWSNVGSVENNGVEVALGVDIIKNKDITWSIDANLGINRNKVTELYEGKDQMTIGGGSGAAGAASRLLKPGLDADTWYIREWAGVNPENGKAMWYKTDKDGSRVKTEKYAEADEVTCGAYTPKFFGGFATDLRWRNLDFNATFGYSVGGKIYNYSRQEIDSDGTYTDRNQMVLLDSWKRWEKPGDIATHPKASLENTYSPNSNKASSRYLEEGSYLKLRSLTIGYNIPLKKWNISNLRVFLAGENLLTFTKYSGVDPEITPSGGVIGENGISSYPQVRKFMLGINITL